jgi:membrane protein DedA with SNARE-associated domain
MCPAALEACVEEFVRNWSNLGVFLGIIATGLGMPMPEELPVVIGGGLVHDTNPTAPRWWLMLVTCIVGVIVGDTCLYLIGRLWGTKLVRLPFVRKRLLPPERLVKISHNFQEYGVKILLFARMTPGIRAPIFVTAGITKLPWIKFLFADGIYAIPGVTILFALGWWFTDNMVDLIKNEAEKAKPIIVLVVAAGIIAYVVYRHLRKPVVEGSPKEMPPVVGPVTARIESKLEQTLGTVKDRILHTGGDSKATMIIPPKSEASKHDDGNGMLGPGPSPPRDPAAAPRAENGQAEPGNGHPAPGQKPQEST